MRYIIIFALFLSQCAFATGPSIAILKITPLSIDAQGALLYRFKTMRNPMGADMFQSAQYGLSVLKDNTFIILEEQEVRGGDDENFDYDTYVTQITQLDQWLQSPCEVNDLIGHFNTCTFADHAINRTMSVAEIQEQYNFDIEKAPLYFLNSGGIKLSNETRINVNYIVDQYLIADFNSFPYCTEEWEEDGSNAQHLPTPAFINNHPFGDERISPYDCINVTGIFLQ